MTDDARGRWRKYWHAKRSLNRVIRQSFEAAMTTVGLPDRVREQAIERYMNPPIVEPPEETWRNGVSRA